MEVHLPRASYPNGVYGDLVGPFLIIMGSLNRVGPLAAVAPSARTEELCKWNV